MKRRLLPFLILSLIGCSPSDQSVAPQMRDHDCYQKTEGDVLEALNGPNGPDYAAAVRIIERSGRAPLQQDYDIGNLLLKACSEKRPYCVPPHGAREGAARLVRVASTNNEDAKIAAGELAAYQRDGAGPSLPADPVAAACWTRVHDGKATPTSCTAG